jgi:GT2 family glycosyltransferase
MDCDVEVSPGAIAQLVKRIETNPRIGLAAPKLIYSNGNLQRSTDVFPTITTKILRYLFLKSLEKRDAKRSKMGKPPQTSFHEVDYAISAMWVFRRELLDRVGLLDERIRYSPEDVDYCLRIWESGYAIAYDSAVACIHHAQEISRGRRINRVTIQHILGLCYYFKKHGYLIRRPKIQDRINH